VLLGVDLLKAAHGDDRHVTAIGNAAERMQRLVDDLLDVSRAETGGLVLERRPCDVRELLDLIAEQFAARAEAAGVRLRLASEPTEPALIDRDRVVQILSNLVANALAFSRRGGEIAVTAARTAGGLRFAVADTGPGIEPDAVGQLFEPYRQGSGGARRGSLGLGLYICRKLVEAHGGRIGVDSLPGTGSTFWFVIPTGQGQAPPGPAKS
jgi:signal transduction histidine kinase